MREHIKHMNYERLKTLYYVGLTGSMTQAGEKMGLCQSAVSKQIQHLESRLGVLLFYRDEKRMILTPEGQLMFNLASKIIHTTDATIKTVHNNFERMSGDFLILTTPSMASSWLPRYLDGFKDLYPHLNIRVRSSTGPINIFDADVVINNFIPDNENLEHLKLFDQVQGIFASTTYLEKFGEPQNVEELEQHRLLALDREIYEKYDHVNWLLKAGIQNSENYRKPFLEFDCNDSAFNAMVEGLGIYSCGIHRISLFNPPKVKHILPQLKSDTIGIYFIYNKNVANAERYIKLYNFLKDKVDTQKKIYEI